MTMATERHTVTVAADRGNPVERALAAAVDDPGRIGDVLSELSRGRVWVPLPAGSAGPDGLIEAIGPVRPDGAVDLPTVIYQGGEFVPAFTSAARMRQWAGRAAQWPDEQLPHLVVAAAALARLLPPRLGIAVNPDAGPSIALSPDGVADLAGRQRQPS